LTTLQYSKEEGGWGLDNIQGKCKVLLYSRIERAKQRKDSTTHIILKRWNVDRAIAHPPNIMGRKISWSHFHQYVIDMAYIPSLELSETMQDYKQRMGKLLQMMEKNTMANTILRIVSKYHNTPWKIVWRNLQTAGLFNTVRSTWYKVIHDIVPTING
jgi:hypothetical protein